MYIVKYTSISKLKNSIHMLSGGWAPLLAHFILNEYNHPSFLVYIILISKLHTIRTHCTDSRKIILDSFIVTDIEYFFKYI